MSYPISIAQTPKCSTVTNASPVTIPEGSYAVSIRNLSTSTANLTVTFANGNTLIIEVGSCESFGVNTILTEIVVTADVGATGQVSWL